MEGGRRGLGLLPAWQDGGGRGKGDTTCLWLWPVASFSCEQRPWLALPVSHADRQGGREQLPNSSLLFIKLTHTALPLPEEEGTPSPQGHAFSRLDSVLGVSWRKTQVSDDGIYEDRPSFFPAHTLCKHY